MTRRWRWAIIILGAIALLSCKVAGILPMGYPEIFGAVAGVVCTMLAIEEHIANFPVGICYSLMYLVIFYLARLYGNMALQGVFLVLGIHGWYCWTRKRQDDTLPITHITRGELIALPLVVIPVTWGLTWYLQQVHAASPILDALTTVLSLYGQYLLNRKRVENWLIGIVAVLFAIYLYASQHLWLTAGLYGCFLILAITGFRTWRRLAQSHPIPARIPTAN